MAETSKAQERRIREDFFVKYCQGKGIDIGCGDDPIVPYCDKWDFSISPTMDATFMKGVQDDTYDWVHSSHCLEDLERPDIAIRNWYRILKRGGYLSLFLPHRDLFEKRKTLPSSGNINHKHYFLIDRDEPPATIGLVPFLTRTLTDYDLIYVKKCDDNYKYTFKEISTCSNNVQVIAEGEFSIECVLRKGNRQRYAEECSFFKGE